MSETQHDYQWSQTENALTSFSKIVKKYVSRDKDRLRKLFLETPCFATEKYDGTNIGKDDEGIMYSRRFLIETGQEEFIKTNLKKVKEANIVKFRNRLIEVSGLDKGNIIKCLVYGELICNELYDYRKREILGDWKVFGAKLEVEKEIDETLDMLLKSGFAVAKKDKNQIQLFLNENFVEVAKYANLDVPVKKAESETIANIVMNNKTDMKRGLVEGLILTVHNGENGYKIIKWKAAHEWQPIAQKSALRANELIQNADVHDDLKKMFKSLEEVITDTSENKHSIKKPNIDTPEKSKPLVNRKSKTTTRKFLSNVDKEIILQGTFHSQKKFDCIEVYIKKGEEYLAEYINNLIKEVRRHLAEEKGEFDGLEENDNILAFIRYTVNNVIKSEIASLDVN
eukprot:GFUD01062302.1.p1 GENE.GFUD01062302.1~~GFUD01062302.1.p1  ORF type:complete len:398 (-),score=107.74 GFUD01062302.1:36-1229(-)